MRDAVAWAVDALAARGATVSGAPAPHAVNVWSSVWTVPTDAGLFWLKAGRPGEGAVERVLASLRPELVVAPVATDPARGWLLTPDAGPTMDANVDPDGVCGMVRDYAALQRGVRQHRQVLHDAGVPLTDPRQAAAVARAQADRLARFPDTDPRHLAPADHDRVVAATPHLAAAGAALADGRIPLTLDHGDLATRNVFPPDAEGRHRFFDFGDARWAHPFESLAMLLWECVRRWRVPMPADVVDLRDPRLRTVLDAYLACWSDLAATDELYGLAAHALRLAPLHRSAVWLRILAGADAAAVARHGRTPWAWLQDVAKPVLL